MSRLRLKNPSQFPPGGFQFKQPEIGWEAPNPISEGVDVLASRVRQLRLNNDVLKRLNLPTSTAVIQQEIVDFICAQNPKLCVTMGDGQGQSANTPQPRGSGCCGGGR